MIIDIQQYAQWCESTWRVGNPQNTPFICLAGFAGESGEIAEEILSGDQQSLQKEFGDFLYYWIRLNQITGHTVFQIEVPELVAGTQYDLHDLCLKFHKYVGRVCECLKKMIATDQDPIGFDADMQKTLNIWTLLVYSQGYSIDSIISANKAKIESRMARGTLFGSGNDR